MNSPDIGLGEACLLALLNPGCDDNGVNKLILLSLLCFSSAGLAEKIEFPKEELAAETVLPVFDKPEAVKNRNVSLDGSFEFGIYGGALLNEAFFRQFAVGATMSFHMSERHGFNLLYAHWLEGETEFKRQIEEDDELDVNLEGAPEIEYMALFNYQYTPWYGKISLTKQTVANLHLYVFLGGGIAGIGGEINPVVSVGLGQKFYFTRNIALRLDLRGLVYQGPDPLSVEIPEGGPIPETSAFDKQIFTNTLISGGLIFLL